MEMFISTVKWNKPRLCITDTLTVTLQSLRLVCVGKRLEENVEEGERCSVQHWSSLYRATGAETLVPVTLTFHG